MMEMLVVMGVAVLLFGKRLPEVGRSLGKGIIEFKKGLQGFEEGFDLTATSSSSSYRRSDDHAHTGSSTAALADTSVPKFEPPAASPVPQMEYQPGVPQD